MPNIQISNLSETVNLLDSIKVFINLVLYFGLTKYLQLGKVSYIKNQKEIPKT